MDKKYPRVKDRKAVLEKTKKHFAPVLGLKNIFVLEENLPPPAEAFITRFMDVDQFVDVFGDLVERDDYHLSSFRMRIKDLDMSISEDTLHAWRKAGCLLWD